LVPTLEALGIEVTLDVQLPNKSRAIIIRNRADASSAGAPDASEPEPTPDEVGPGEEPESTEEDLGPEEQAESPRAPEPPDKVRMSF
jgi:hypothetical protein